MTKKQICEANKTIGYYSGLNGLEIRYIEYGIDDVVYCVSGTWSGKKSFHRLKINYDSRGNAFVRLHGYKIPFDEILRA